MNFSATLAVVARNLRIGFRRRDLLVQSIAVPVVILGLASIIFGGTDAWPIAVVDQSHSTASREYLDSLQNTRGATGPYFRVIETNPEKAGSDVESGRLHLFLELPPDFAQRRTVSAHTYNINTDAMKNVRLRLTTTANLYDSSQNVRQLSVTLDKRRPSDIRRTAFMGGSAVILAFLLGCCLIAANLFSVDIEHRSVKEISLSPAGSAHAGLGAAVAAVVLALVTTLPTVVLALLFHTRASWADMGQTALIVLPSGLAAAGIGVVVATILRHHRTIQPTVILIWLGSYFASGGFISVPALPPLARDFAQWWPVSYVFENANPVLHGFAESPDLGFILLTCAAALIGLLLAMLAARSEPDRARSQGQ